MITSLAPGTLTRICCLMSDTVGFVIHSDTCTQQHYLFRDVQRLDETGGEKAAKEKPYARLNCELIRTRI